METAIETRDRLREVALDLIRSVFPPPRGIRLVGVSVSNFGSQTVGEAAELPFRENNRAALQRTPSEPAPSTRANRAQNHTKESPDRRIDRCFGLTTFELG
jgi:hypothetical protein